MNFTTGSFEYEDIKDRNYSESKGFGVNTSIGGNITDKGSLNLAPSGSTTLSFNNTGSKQKQDTKATLGQGNITIGGVSNPELAGLNRDVSNSQEITYDKIERGLDGSVTIDNRVILGFLTTEAKDDEGNTIYEKNADGTQKLDENGAPIAKTISGYESIANDFVNFVPNLVKAGKGMAKGTKSVIEGLEKAYNKIVNESKSTEEAAIKMQAGIQLNICV